MSNDVIYGTGLSQVPTPRLPSPVGKCQSHRRQGCRWLWRLVLLSAELGHDPVELVGQALSVTGGELPDVNQVLHVAGCRLQLGDGFLMVSAARTRIHVELLHGGCESKFQC